MTNIYNNQPKSQFLWMGRDIPNSSQQRERHLIYLFSPLCLLCLPTQTDVSDLPAFSFCLPITLVKDSKNILRLKPVKLHYFLVADSDPGIHFFLSRQICCFQHLAFRNFSKARNFLNSSFLSEIK